LVPGDGFGAVARLVDLPRYYIHRDAMASHTSCCTLDGYLDYANKLIQTKDTAEEGDHPVCRLFSSAGFDQFGTPGDGLDGIDNDAEVRRLARVVGSGNVALVNKVFTADGSPSGIYYPDLKLTVLA